MGGSELPEMEKPSSDNATPIVVVDVRARRACHLLFCSGSGAAFPLRLVTRPRIARLGKRHMSNGQSARVENDAPSSAMTSRNAQRHHSSVAVLCAAAVTPQISSRLHRDRSGIILQKMPCSRAYTPRAEMQGGCCGSAGSRHQKKLTCKCWIICCNVFLLTYHALLLRLSETNNPVIVKGGSGGRVQAGDLETIVVRIWSHTNKKRLVGSHQSK